MEFTSSIQFFPGVRKEQESIGVQAFCVGLLGAM